MEDVHPQASCCAIEVVRFDRPLCDPAACGFAGDSRYVEVVYGGVLGPSATAIYRRLYWAVLAARDRSVRFDLRELALAVGVKSSIAQRSVDRLIDFRFAHVDGHELAIRKRLPPVSERMLGRLSPSVVALHRAAMRAMGGPS